MLQILLRKTSSINLVCVVTCFFCSSSIAHADNEQHIKSFIQAQAEAWNQGDIDGFMESYWNSPKLTFTSSGQITRGWQATLDRYHRTYDTPDKMGHLTFDELEYSELAEGAALVLGSWHLDRGDDSIGGKFSLVWKKIDGHWKIVHDHTSSLESDE